jgi:short-subunit dehydrogenase
MSQRTVLITGASSGIGEAFADVFAAEGFAVVAVARREDRLHALASRLHAQHGTLVHVVPCDLGLPDARARLCADLAARGLVIDALVNNAGYGVPGTFGAVSWERHHAALQVMTVGLAELTYRLLPGMLERRWGRIINVASLAGLVPAPAGHTLYAATKAFAIKFSEALAGESRPHGVHVTALCPGFTLSEFHDVTGTRGQVSTLPRWLWSEASMVARAGFDAVTRGDAVYVPGRVNQAIAALARVVPMPVVNAVGRRIGRRYRKV